MSQMATVRRRGLGLGGMGVLAGILSVHSGPTSAQNLGDFREAGHGLVNYTMANATPQVDCGGLKRRVTASEGVPLIIVSA